MKRHDGRRHDEVRRIEVARRFLTHAEGSVFFRQGNTWVLCAASVEEDVPPFLKGTGKGWVTAEYALLPRSTAFRIPRESRSGKVQGRTFEIQRLIGRSLRSVVDLDRLGPRTLRVDCDVIQADGGTRTASITGAYLVLEEAVTRMLEMGLIAENPLKDRLAAVSAGIVDGEVLLDLDYEEDSRADVDANFVMTGSGAFVEIQATAEGSPFAWSGFELMAGLGRKGITDILDILRGC